MSNRTKSRFFLAGVLVVGVAVMLNLYGRLVPESAPGWTRFQLIYNSTSNKSEFLDDYQKNIWEHGGGHVPDLVARFLVNRLESSQDGSEVSDIVRFDSLQAGGREAQALFDLSNQARRRVAQTVLRDWRTCPSWGMEHGFVLLEGLRQNTYLGKANVIGPHFKWPASQQQLAPIAVLFDKWNRKYAAVPFTKRPNPLAGTPFQIEAP